MNEQDQYVNDGQSAYFGVPQMPRNDRADLLDKIKPEVIIEQVRHRLLGEDLVDGVWRPVPALQNRALTPIGAWEISNLMLGTASINVSISKLDNNEIKNRLRGICRSAMLSCAVNWKEYGIKDSSQLWHINQIVFTNALVVLKQADEASIQELLKGTVTESRLVQSSPKQPGRMKRIMQGFLG